MTSTRGGRTGGDTERVGQSLFFTHAIHKYHYQNQHKTIERAMGTCVHMMRSNKVHFFNTSREASVLAKFVLLIDSSKKPRAIKTSQLCEELTHCQELQSEWM